MVVGSHRYGSLQKPWRRRTATNSRHQSAEQRSNAEAPSRRSGENRQRSGKKITALNNSSARIHLQAGSDQPLPWEHISTTSTSGRSKPLSVQSAPSAASIRNRAPR